MTDMSFARNLTPPYYAVIFANQWVDDPEDYSETAARMVELAAGIDGYLGHESARDCDGFGITVSYWRDEGSITRWRQHAEHLAAQEAGKRKWYAHYELRVARVERAYAGPEGQQEGRGK